MPRFQKDEVIIPYVRAMSAFRDGVRAIAMSKGETGFKDILTLCDRLRDVDLIPLGVALDDQEGVAAVVL
jgi:cysteinyl-tRNA synthetase